MNVYNNPTARELAEVLQRPAHNISDMEDTVRQVFKAVKGDGDKAVRAYTKKFDKVDTNRLQVTEAEIDAAEARLSPELKKAIQHAAENIEKFHRTQILSEPKVAIAPGISCWREARGIESVGLYIPGGTAPLFSTVLMLGIPARLADCKEVILCTPPKATKAKGEGEIPAAILYAAKITGITQIYKAGGVQAIAAMVFGTESIPKAYKIFGPGNQFVTIAKQFALQHGTAIDMPAGPSEVMIVADRSANASYVAADLLSQAEHGADSQVILITFSEGFAEQVQDAVESQLMALSRRETAHAALKNSTILVLEDIAAAIKTINDYAPEHLILAVEDEMQYIPFINNAGSVFIGNLTPESCGDYASGTNHTLPTNGYAKAYSGVSVDSFVKKITFQKIDHTGLQNIGQTVITMAKAEGLDAHAHAVNIRLQDLKNMNGAI
jgi:histidinol dehydrogenase